VPKRAGAESDHHRTQRTLSASVAEVGYAFPLQPLSKWTVHASIELQASAEDVQKPALGALGKTAPSIDGSTFLSSTMVWSSVRLGKRQLGPPLAQ
jgi:hypothetical protein